MVPPPRICPFAVGAKVHATLESASVTGIPGDTATGTELLLTSVVGTWLVWLLPGEVLGSTEAAAAAAAARLDAKNCSSVYL